MHRAHPPRPLPQPPPLPPPHPCRPLLPLRPLPLLQPPPLHLLDQHGRWGVSQDESQLPVPLCRTSQLHGVSDKLASAAHASRRKLRHRSRPGPPTPRGEEAPVGGAGGEGDRGGHAGCRRGGARGRERGGEVCGQVAHLRVLLLPEHACVCVASVTLSSPRAAARVRAPRAGVRPAGLCTIRGPSCGVPAVCLGVCMRAKPALAPLPSRSRLGAPCAGGPPRRTRRAPPADWWPRISARPARGTRLRCRCRCKRGT
mmetsp:Transcript_39922/g.96296  ORF Transcript_39922/g.96296 Transcript_39922/m.96296 type:complete len:257 (-) Transcript_39922:447-1217(-)